MKTPFLLFIFSIALALCAVGQTPTPATSASPQPSASATASVSATVDESIKSEVERKLKRKFGDHDSSDTSSNSRKRHHISFGDDDEDMGVWAAIPIVGIIFSTLFGAPVLVVAAIMFFSYLRSRSLHRTVREMVEKGQPVPAALFAPPPVVRARSDMRRGVVLLMVGFGLMIFFGAVNDWEGGVWSLGLIPFLIGAGYLLVWKLEGGKDKIPPLP
ncbi:MAG: hypothetical protein QOH88_2238 [Verrucomicrobiota bacterium]|jgi:hypothetical protein